VKQTVTLRVPIDDDRDGGDRMQVYTDLGTGTVDTAKPLLSRGAEVFPGYPPGEGLGDDPIGEYAIGDSRPPLRRTGIGEEELGNDPIGEGTAEREIDVNVPAGFGRLKFAVEVADAYGNVQAGAAQEVTVLVSGTEPSPLRSFTFGSYDAPSDQVTFSFARNAE
jgi:hypothetical protein